MDPLTLALIAAGTATAKGISAGIERKQARTAAEQAFTEEEARRLQELQAMREAGALGLTEQQQAALDAQFRQQQAAQAQATQAEQLAAQASRPMSARDVFLQEAATQAVQQQAVQEQNMLRLQAEQAAQAAQEQELQQLLMSRLQAQQIEAGAPSITGAVVESLAAQAPMVGEAFAAGALEQERLDALLETYQGTAVNDAYNAYLG
jgi:hypothetical protein